MKCLFHASMEVSVWSPAELADVCEAGTISGSVLVYRIVL